jgi:hypothetical protein
MTEGVGVPIVALGLDIESDNCVHRISKYQYCSRSHHFAMEGRYTQVYFGAGQSLIGWAFEVQSNVSVCTCIAKKLRAFE